MAFHVPCTLLAPGLMQGTDAVHPSAQDDDAAATIALIKDL